MSDHFHKEVRRSFIEKVNDAMEKFAGAGMLQFTHQACSHYPLSQSAVSHQFSPAHIWLGVSVEDAKNAVSHLKATPASVKFVRLSR